MKEYKGNAKNKEFRRDVSESIFWWLTLICYTVLISFQFIK